MSNRSIASPEQLFAEEQRLPANCFTVKRYGQVTEGIELSFEQGPHQSNPWAPHVNVGGWRVQHDTFNGCGYKVQQGGTGLIRRAQLRTCLNKSNGKGFSTLVRPEVEKPGFSLVKVDLRLPGVKGSVVEVKGRTLNLYSGSAGGRIVECNEYEALIELKEGEKLTLFFPDGAVRRFIREARPVERQLTVEAQLQARIVQAWAVLEEQLQLPVEQCGKAMAWTLQGMVDLINLTAVMDRKGEGQELRLMLLREFFLELDSPVFGLCERRLVAALYQIDPALVDVAVGKVPARALPEGISDLDKARRDQERVKREARRAANRAAREAEAPQKTAKVGGGKNHQTSNPDKAAKRARKHGRAA